MKNDGQLGAAAVALAFVPALVSFAIPSALMRLLAGAAAGALLLVVAWFVYGRRIAAPLARLDDGLHALSRGEWPNEMDRLDGGEAIARAIGSYRVLVTSLRALYVEMNQTAGGDLTGKPAIEGALARAFGQVVENQRALVDQIARSAAQISAAAGQILAASEQQARGADRQVRGVEAIDRALSEVVEHSRHVGEEVQGILRAAEANHDNFQVVAERIRALSTHAQRINDILDVVKDIAAKSEFLALKAALEGAKTGEAGRGFSLVARQMQDLAERVTQSVKDIQRFTVDMREATNTSTIATDVGVRLAADTTKSAREITSVVRELQTGSEGVSGNLGTVSEVARESAHASAEASEAIRELTHLSEELRQRVARFKFGAEAR